MQVVERVAVRGDRLQRQLDALGGSLPEQVQRGGAVLVCRCGRCRPRPRPGGSAAATTGQPGVQRRSRLARAGQEGRTRRRAAAAGRSGRRTAPSVSTAAPSANAAPATDSRAVSDVLRCRPPAPARPARCRGPARTGPGRDRPRREVGAVGRLGRGLVRSGPGAVIWSRSSSRRSVSGSSTVAGHRGDDPAARAGRTSVPASRSVIASAAGATSGRVERVRDVEPGRGHVGGPGPRADPLDGVGVARDHGLLGPL